MTLQSYKPYARFVTVISAIIVIIAGLDASQVISLFPEYASQINSILMIAGLIAPAIAQEKRVVRAEDLIKEDMSEPYTDEEDEDNVHIHIVVDGDDILETMEDSDDEISESDGA